MDQHQCTLIASKQPCCYVADKILERENDCLMRVLT